jgi:predicted HTH transcriptional regulator
MSVFEVEKLRCRDKVDLIENEEYGYCCLLKATDRVLEKLLIENKTFVKITSKTRLERKMADPAALREAVINGIVHNEFHQEVPPVVEIYSDRLTITSHGGLIEGLGKEDFFNCISKPRNRVLMRVFKDAGMVEQLGSGMSRILKAYDRSIFHFSDHFLIVTFPFDKTFTVSNDTVNDTVKKEPTINRILMTINADPSITIDGLVTSLGKSRSTVLREIKKLKEAGILKRNGSDKSGKWQII